MLISLKNAFNQSSYWGGLLGETIFLKILFIILNAELDLHAWCELLVLAENCQPVNSVHGGILGRGN